MLRLKWKRHMRRLKARFRRIIRNCQLSCTYVASDHGLRIWKGSKCCNWREHGSFVKGFGNVSLGGHGHGHHRGHAHLFDRTQSLRLVLSWGERTRGEHPYESRSTHNATHTVSCLPIGPHTNSSGLKSLPFLGRTARSYTGYRVHETLRHWERGGGGGRGASLA